MLSVPVDAGYDWPAHSGRQATYCYLLHNNGAQGFVDVHNLGGNLIKDFLTLVGQVCTCVDY